MHSPLHARGGDTRAGAYALFTATTIIALQVAGKATRDALFLSNFDVTTLPRIVILAAVLSIVAVLLFSRALGRHGPLVVMPKAFAFSATLFVGEWVLYNFSAPLASLLLYLHMAIFGGLLISGFWSVVNERFDPHSAKQTIARVAAAATLGGVLGGVVAERVSSLVDLQAMLLVLSALHGACVAGIRGIGSLRPPAEAPEPATMRTGMQVLFANRYLSRMAWLVILVAVTAGFLDYALKSTAAEQLAGGEALVAFFASFYAGIGVLTFVIQTLFGAPILRRFGLIGTAAVLPGIIILGGAAAILVPRLLTVALARGGETVIFNSFFRAGFELLYTPVAASSKRLTKTIIDVASNRAGDMLGGGLLLALVTAAPHAPVGWFIGVAITAAALQLLLLMELRRGYVGQLAQSLHDGSLSLEIDETIDATTRRVLAETSPASDRDELLARIARRARRRPGAETAAAQDAYSGSEPTHVQVIADLTSGRAERVQRALNSAHITTDMAPYLLDLLEITEFAEDARIELRWMVPWIIGQLTDALLDPDTPLVIRQRLPSIMEIYHNPRSLRGLVEGLSDPEFTVRYSCARALARMRGRDREFNVPAARVMSMVRNEVDVDDEAWSAPERLAAIELGPDTGLEAITQRGADYSLGHVFVLLGLVLDPKATRLAMYALQSRDKLMRGTALEYLENVLPPDVCVLLWRRIGVRRSAAARSTRTPREIVADLRNLVRQIRPDVDDSN
jgi:hypothetical protein